MYPVSTSSKVVWILFKISKMSHQKQWHDKSSWWILGSQMSVGNTQWVLGPKGVVMNIGVQIQRSPKEGPHADRMVNVTNGLLAFNSGVI